MPLINTAVTNLIQGVSQQPDAVRFSGQCEVQENALGSVVDGLQKRPATQHVATLLANAALDANAKVHFIERDNNERYAIVIKGDTKKTITAYNLDTGTKSTISQTFRGVVSSFVFGVNSKKWGTDAERAAVDAGTSEWKGYCSCAVTFTQDCPIIVPRADTALMGVVKVVGGGGISTVEYPLINVADDADEWGLSAASSSQLGPKQIHFRLPEDDVPGGTQLESKSLTLFGADTGELQTVIEYTVLSAPNSDLLLADTNYLNKADSGYTTPKDDLKLLTTGDVTYVLNTKKTVAKDSTTTRPVSNDALVFIKQGDYEKKYGVRVDVEGKDGDGVEDSGEPYENWYYSGASQAKTSPAGTVFYNTAKNAQADYILERLFGSVTTATTDAQGVNVSPTDPYLNNPFQSATVPSLRKNSDFTAELLSPQLGVIRADSTVSNWTVYPVDSTGGASIGVSHKAVTTITDLPKVAPHRYKVEVQGDIEEATDNRYVQFLVAGSDADTPDGEVGQGSWSEIGGDAVSNRIDPLTMPLVLRSTAENTFDLAHFPLDELLAGDANTNPDPSFVGSTIDGVFSYKGRLGFLSGASVSMTEVKFGSYDGVHGIQNYNFYRASVASLLDSAPIDVTVSSANVVNLRNAIAFQDSLVLFSDFGQFVLRSGDILTSSTVSANPITEYECDLSVSPIALGSYIYFPFSRGRYTGVREFTVNANTDIFNADEITAHVPQYIPEGIVSMTGCSSEDLMALTDGTDIYIYKYFFNGAEKVLSSWSKFTISGGGVRGVGFVDSDLYIVQSHGTHAQTLLLKLPLENKHRDIEGHNTHLDRRVDLTFNADAAAPSFTVPYLIAAGETLQAYTDDGLLLQNLEFTENTTTGITTVTFKNNVVSGGVTGAAVKLYAGIAYTMKYTFSEQSFKASSGEAKSPTNSGRMLMRNGSIFFTDTAHFVVKVTPYLRGTSESEFNATVVQATTEGTIALESNSFRFPVFSDPKGTVITIENATAAPCNLQSAEFESFVHQRSRRYG